MSGPDTIPDFRKILLEYIDHVELLADKNFIEYLDTQPYWFEGLLSDQEVAELIRCRNEITLRNN